MQEERFDAFTAIVGAGPAYFALLAETLVEIAHKEGFEKPESWINTLMLGTSKIYDEEKEIGFKNIMSMVASKGGVTEKALETIKENGYPEDFRGASGWSKEEYAIWAFNWLPDAQMKKFKKFLKYTKDDEFDENEDNEKDDD